MTSADFDPQYGYPPAGSPHGQAGGLGARFFARLIDGILINIVVFVLSVFLFDRDYWWLVTRLFSGVLMFGYFVLLEVTQGATLGKRLLGLTVHGPGGAPRPDATQSAIRNSFTLLAVVPYLMPAAGVHRLRRHRRDDQRQPNQAGQARRTGRRHPGSQVLTDKNFTNASTMVSTLCPTSMAIPYSSGSSGSSASNWDISNDDGMKWPGLPACLAPICSGEPVRCRNAISVLCERNWSRYRRLSAEQLITPSSWSASHCPTASSHGRRSLSSSGAPSAIFATLAAG